MLLHSRTGKSQRVPTNLNELTEQALHWAYQDMQAHDKDFRIRLITKFAEGLPSIAGVPQDLSRVLLNIFTNAFYAVQQRQKIGQVGYEPEVRVQTSLLATGHVEICVRDNGIGIPKAVQDKIFQPFFTTKPSNEGVGLGLSLSYNIITHSHGGTLTVTSREGEYTEFRVCLPGTQPVEGPDKVEYQRETT
jgi:two-component system NtrC family sensor kinase